MANNDISPSLQAVLEHGNALEAAGQPRAAMAQYQALLGELHFSIARCARALNDRPTELEHLEKALVLDPGNRQWRFNVAQALLALGQSTKAHGHYQELATTKPGDAAAHAGLGRCAKKSGALREALVHFQDAFRLQPGNTPFLFEIAEIQRSLGMTNEAAAMYNQLLALAPNNHAAHSGLAYVLRRQGKRREAGEHFAAAAALQPDNPVLRLEAATEQRETRQFAKARTTARTVLDANPQHLPAILNLAETERAAGQLKAALELLEQGLEKVPRDPQTLIKAAHCLRELQRLDEAITMYGRVIAEEPGNGWAYLGMGQSAKRLGRLQEAEDCFAKALALASDDIGLRLDLSAEHRYMGRFDEARTLAQNVLTTAPANYRALTSLAETERAAGRHEVALGVLEQCLEIAPRDPQMLIRAAHCLRSLERLDEAIAMYRRVIAEEPGNGWAHLGMGQSAKRLGRLQEAEDCFGKALALSPNDTGLRLDLSAEHRYMGRFDEARTLAQNVLTAAPADLRAMTSLAETERAAGRYEEALQWLERTRALRPLDTDILVKMAGAARLLGRQDECNNYLEAALQIDPLSVSAIRSLAEQYLRADDADAALELLRPAALERPNDTALQLTLLDALITAGMPQAALALMDELEIRLGAHPNILIKRAHTLRRIGLYHESAAANLRATTLYPYHDIAWFERFETEILLSPDAEIEALLDAAPAVTPQEIAQQARCRGAFAERQWRFDDAAAHYKTALALHPQNAGVAFNLARVYLLTLDLAQVKVQLQHHRDIDAPNLRLRGKSLNTSQTLYGQLLDEYALNETPPRVRPLLSLPPADRLDALLPLVEAEPDNTAAAVALVLALRLSGALSEIVHPGDTAIPKLIFQFWDSRDIPEDIATYRASWHTHNPDYTVHAFDNAAALKFLQSTFPPAVAQAYRHAIEPAQKADIFRLAVLFAHGGVYADADDRCQQPLRNLLPETASLVLYQEDLGTIANNFIATAPRHPLILKALQLAIQAINRGDSDITWLSTGPGMVTRAFAQTYALGEQRLPGQTLVYSLRELSPVIAVHCHCAYKKTKKHWSNSSFSRKRDVSHLLKTAQS
jgi:tetratricopeptide (TPR) repeat protein